MKQKNYTDYSSIPTFRSLYERLGREKKQISIGISGTHGKTTTTGMAGLIFENAKLHPSIVVGGTNAIFKHKFQAWKRELYFISELDESDGSVQLYSPNVSIITNLEFDHPDYYKNGMEQLIEYF